MTLGVNTERKVICGLTKGQVAAVRDYSVLLLWAL